MRLDKYLANMGIGSRKMVRALIRAGNVRVNGVVASEAEQDVRENEDEVYVGTRKISYKQYVYIMMNKPSGYLSATEDAHGQPVATDITSEEYGHYKLSPAGRLDKDSEGFLLLTNDGAYIHRVITPESHVNKRYFVRLEKDITDDDIDAFASGVRFADGTVCRAALLERSDEEATAYVTICEGKFHQVKKMFLTRGNAVVYLKRMSIGNVDLDSSLSVGEYREMTDEEVKGVIGT